MTPRRPDGDAQQILRNAGHLLLAYVVPRVFTVGSVVVAARWLGADGFGSYGAAAALAVILSVVASVGMLPLLVRQIARWPDRAGALLRAAHEVKAGTTLLMLLAAWVVSGRLFEGAGDARSATMVLALGWSVHAFAENVAAYYQAVERMGRWTQASAAFGVVSAVVGVSLLVVTDSVVLYCWGFVAGWCAALFWLLRGLPAGLGRGRARADDRRLVLRELAPFAGAFVGLTVYCKVDVLLLEAWSTEREVGLYTAAYKAIDVAQALVIVAAGAVYPRLSRAAVAEGGSEGRGRISADLLLLAALPAGLVLHLVAAPAVRVLFGVDYAGAASMLSWLSLLIPMLAVTILGGYVLGAAGRMGMVASFYAVGVGVNVALNLALVPAYGGDGSALARLGSESMLVVAFAAALHVQLRAGPRPRVLAAGMLSMGVALSTRVLPDPSGGFGRAALALMAIAVVYRGLGVLDMSQLSRLLRRGGPEGPLLPASVARGGRET